jgi:hypothetical protein
VAAPRRQILICPTLGVNSALRELRYWISLLFLGSTLLSGGSHHHAREDLEATARPEKGCGDDCAHFAGHDAPDLSQFSTHCSACQLRTDPLSSVAAEVVFFQLAKGRLDQRPVPIGAIVHVTTPTSRAPPSV